MAEADDSRSRDQAKFIVRLGSDLHARIAAASKQTGRSMNAEIVQRLESTFAANRLSNPEVRAALESDVEELRERLLALEKRLPPVGLDRKK